MRAGPLPALTPRTVDSTSMLMERLRSLARGARHLPDRLLHPWRRRAASRTLARQARPRMVLFVCHGNICRSPYAAAVARRLLPAGVAVESAGFFGPGRPSPAEALAAAAERGIDLSRHRSQLITPEQQRRSDVVVVMDAEQQRRLAATQPGLSNLLMVLGDLDPEAITRRAVADPVDQPVDAFRSSYDRIERCVRVFAALWPEGSGRDAQS
jgi:protein-tyrosine-phosphatase